MGVKLTAEFYPNLGCMTKKMRYHEPMKLISWNVNGIRAAQRKGFLDWLYKEQPDALGIQEIKAKTNQLDQEVIEPQGYYGFFNPAERPGYSGTAIYSKKKPAQVLRGMNEPNFDNEGRVIAADYDDFIFFNIYFPNGKASPERLQYKLDFYDRALEYFNSLVKSGRKLLIAGDYNTAHHAIDLARPKENEKISGFLPIERDWLDRLVDAGYSDCFRKFTKDPEHYTWWSMRANSRARNVGWRIDYFFASNNIIDEVKNCYHLTDVMGSDHCPVVLEI